MLNRWRIFAACLILAGASVVLPSEIRAEIDSPIPAKYRAKVESAVANALEFLAKDQAANRASDALFSGKDGKTNAVAGLVGMAFRSNGYTPRDGRYSEAMRGCIDYVLASPSRNGYLGVRGGRMSAHGIATLFLIEMSGKVDAERQKKIDALLPKALKVIVDAQKVPKKDKMYRGGWRHSPEARNSDISVTGWQLRALRAAQLKGLAVPPESILNAVAFIERCVREDDGGFRHDPSADWRHKQRGFWVRNSSSPARTGVGILCRELTGHHADAINARAGNYVLKSTRGKGKFLPSREIDYGTYYCSQAMFQLGGKYWQRFAPAMYEHVLPLQHATGAWQNEKKGDAYATALYVLALTVSNRQVRVPHVIDSRMVLQRGVPVTIWGWAGPGDGVTVELAGNKVAAAANTRGEWKVMLPKMKAGGPHKMTISGKNTITLTDILVGEVWIGSGQSNMEWGVAGAASAGEAVATAKYPKIRLFLVPKVLSGIPKRDVNATWRACTPGSVRPFSAVLYFFGRKLHKDLDVPVGLIASSWGGSIIEPWTPPAGFAAVEELKGLSDKVRTAPKGSLSGWASPTAMYNAMISPLVPFTVRGAIWYQGESNLNDGMLYAHKKRALVEGWRKVWGNDKLSFYWAQLAPFNYGGDPYRLPRIWEAQRAAMSIPRTGMAVITDIGHLGDIHPRNKQDVGKRLALWALAKDYGRDVIYSGPIYKSMKIEGNKVRVSFDHTGTGLKSRNGEPLNWFEISDGTKFVKAKAVINGKTVVVSSDQVAKPKAVRFGWHQLAEPNLQNSAGLPACPFRSTGTVKPVH